MTFVDKFLEHTKQHESPKSFWKWAAYTAIAATVRDNVFFKQGANVIYPNIYVLLLAGSAEHRKGSPIALCEKLVKAVQTTKIISGRASIQAVLDELSRSETNQKTGQLLAGGSAIFFARELSAGLVKDPEAIRILTDIYDSMEEYTSRLRGSGTFKIKNLCFSFFAATNEELLTDVYDKNAMYGGLLGRTFLIKPNEFRPGNTLFGLGDNTHEFQELVKILKEISTVRGMMTFTQEAIKEYENWYIPFRESYRNRTDKSGVSGRIHTSILKLSVILALNETKSLTVLPHHIEHAIEESLSLVKNYKQLLLSSGTSNIADVGAIVLNDLHAAPDYKLTRKEILRRHWNRFDAEMLDKLTTTLIQAGMLSEGVENNLQYYVLTPKCLETLYKEI